MPLPERNLDRVPVGMLHSLAICRAVVRDDRMLALIASASAVGSLIFILGRISDGSAIDNSQLGDSN